MRAILEMLLSPQAVVRPVTYMNLTRRSAVAILTVVWALSLAICVPMLSKVDMELCQGGSISAEQGPCEQVYIEQKSLEQISICTKTNCSATNSAISHINN